MSSPGGSPALISPRHPSPSYSQASGSRRRPSSSSSDNPTIYTLTACIRCHLKKQKCDTGLPRCRHCEKARVPCQFWDASKKRQLSREYIVHLQKQVKALEDALERAGRSREVAPDDELMLRKAAVVQFRSSEERKYLGPASGTPMIRIVMQLAKQVLGVHDIYDVISLERAKAAEAKVEEDSGKATSKVDPEMYPLVSSYAAREYEELPGQKLIELFTALYNKKVQTMYPVFHEKTLENVFHDVYAGSTDAFKNFVVRMVFAVGLQRLDKKYAGLGDSLYLGALSYLEDAVRPMNLETLQCFCLIAEYSLLTPTRTAIYHVTGVAMRLAQALGITEESTLVVRPDGTPCTPMEADMKRRAFWAIATMDYGLTYSLGRPAAMATELEHFDVKFFEEVPDEYITSEGIYEAQPSMRKWIAKHFYKMRLIQIEIRRMLYRSKRDSPVTDEDPWFAEIQRKMADWRDGSPYRDEGSGLSKMWFVGRYNTMVVLLFRPSPQIARPSPKAALRVYEACEFNIHMQRQQVTDRSVEVTWAFTQTLFSSINAILWTISYAEVRKNYDKDHVRDRLSIAMKGISVAAEKWPGVESASQLYEVLIEACLRVYDQDGDLPIQDHIPFDSDVGSNYSESSRSRTASPQAKHIKLGDPRMLHPGGTTHKSHDYHPHAIQSQFTSANHSHTSPPLQNNELAQAHGNDIKHNTLHVPPMTPPYDSSSISSFTGSQFTPLPSTFPELNNWTFEPTAQSAEMANFDYTTLLGPYQDTMARHGSAPFFNADEFQIWHGDGPERSRGLNPEQQAALRSTLEETGINDIYNMVDPSRGFVMPGNVI